MNLAGLIGRTGHTGYTGLWRFSTGCTVQFRKYRETTSGYFARQLVYSMISIPPQAISVQSAVCSKSSYERQRQLTLPHSSAVPH